MLAGIQFIPNSIIWFYCNNFIFVVLAIQMGLPNPNAAMTVDHIIQSCFFVSGPVSQVAPSWCLLSSTCQFQNGVPKSLNLLSISQDSATAAKICTILLYFTQNSVVKLMLTISSHFHNLKKKITTNYNPLQPYLANLNHFEPLNSTFKVFSAILK